MASGISGADTRSTTMTCTVDIQYTRSAPTRPIARNTGQVYRLHDSANASSTSTATTSAAYSATSTARSEVSPSDGPPPAVGRDAVEGSMHRW